jgi:hypothetical protein
MLASLTIGKGTRAAATHTADRNPVLGHLHCWAFAVESLWDHIDLEFAIYRGRI